jgi:dihydroorotase
MAYDLILKGGTLIDPAQGIHTEKDVAFKAGTVSAVGDDLATEDAAQVIDCTDHLIVPGLIDVHVHVFWGCGHYSMEPDPNCIAKGVTTVLDAGSAGADNFEGFRRYVMEASDTRIFAFLHISSQGLLTANIGELENIQYANVSRCVDMIEKHRDRLLGVKVRLTNNLVQPSAGIQPLFSAREAADAVGLPIMVHPNNAWCDTIDDILAVMKEGDILTHCFHGSGCGILDKKGNLRDSVRDAADRGVLFDVGHGKGSFKWEVVEAALDQGLIPFTISSDLHVYNIDGPVYDLSTTISKFLHLGMTLDDAVLRSTANPAQLLGMSGRIGTLKSDARGDAVVMKLETGSFDFFDAHGACRKGGERLVPKVVIKDGKEYK